MSDRGAAAGQEGLIVLAGSVLVMAVVVLINLFGDDFSIPRLPSATEKSSSADALYVTRTVRVRSGPTVESQTLRNLERGDTVSGEWVTGDDGHTPWLRISKPGEPQAYVWGKNLSWVKRPALLARRNYKAEVIAPASLRREISLDSELLEEVAPGTMVSVVGEVEGGMLEVTRRHGGVGYMPASAVRPKDSRLENPDGWASFLGRFRGAVAKHDLGILRSMMAPDIYMPMAVDGDPREMAMHNLRCCNGAVWRYVVQAAALTPRPAHDSTHRVPKMALGIDRACPDCDYGIYLAFERRNGRWVWVEMSNPGD